MPEVPSTAITTIIGITLGSTWNAISRAGEPPRARAAVTKSRSAIDNVSARTTRAICVHETRPITSSTLSRLGWSTATKAIASSSAGNVSITSVNRIRAKSAAPPKKPATSPIATPIVIVITIAATPTISETRAPQMMRESTSRPSSSVPSGKAADGAPGSP